MTVKGVLMTAAAGAALGAAAWAAGVGAGVIDQRAMRGGFRRAARAVERAGNKLA